MADKLTSNTFKPAWWLPGGHLQTLWAYIVTTTPKLEQQQQRLELEDGDFLDLFWFNTVRADQPIVLLLHGLGGNSRSRYILESAQQLMEDGFAVVAMNHRGAGEEANRLAKQYHSGQSADLELVISKISQQYPDNPLHCAGFSMGGNILLKWLGERPGEQRVQRAVAVSVPYQLDVVSARLQQGLSRLYQGMLLGYCKDIVRKKRLKMHLPFDVDAALSCKCFKDFDELVTAQLNGFASAEDYYAKCSSRQFVRHITQPTLLIHAQNDPFMTEDIAPRRHELSESVTMALTPSGGHVGFVQGLGRQGLWLYPRISAFLRELA